MSHMTANQLGFVEDSDGTIRIEDIVIPPAPLAAVTSECPESRLIIDTIIINNFKSYAGTQKPLGPFNKNLTCIVGPNGSGKSNVIDSLLFVFGYRSKQIRSDKISELIHNSAEHPARSCKVTVNFAYIKDDDSNEIISGSRFSVARTAFREGSSFYELNNKRVQYKEIAAVLRAHGIDLEHNRFLILQGEIEAISLMPPKGMTEHETGMLEYIEDVIGSNRLIEPIKQLEKKAQELGEEYRINFDDLEKIEKEKNMWEAPKSKAIEYLKLKNSICKIENSLYHLKRYETEKTVEANNESKMKLTEEMKAFKTEWENIRSSKKALENSMSRVSSEYDGLQKAIEEKKEQFAKLELKDTANNDSLKTLRHKVKSLEHTLETTQNELTKLNKQSVVYEQETNELQTKKKNLEEEKGIQEKEMNEVMASMKQEIDKKQKMKDSAEVELVKLKKKSCEIKSEMNSAQSKLNLLKSGGNKEQGKLKSLMSSHQKAVSAAANEEKYLKAEQDKMKSTEQEIETCSQELKEAKLNEGGLISELQAIRKKLEEARLAVSTSSHRNVMIKAFMKEKAKGRFTGVYGRLGDLGGIDEKYDVAISTICGQLDSFVTDTLTTAQEGVIFLKENNLGYATFIPIDQMKQKFRNRPFEKISTPENIPRLFDLIKVNDPEVRYAFYFALQDTLVARDIEHATRVSMQGKQRHRVVTLNGELVDKSGTMSGGGNTIKGRIGQKVVEISTVTQEDVNNIQSEMEAINHKLSTIRKQKMNLDERISQKSSVISSLQHSLKKRMQNFQQYNANVKVLSAQLEEQKEKLEATEVDEEEVAALESQIKQIGKEYTKSVEAESVVEQKVARFQAEILEITKGKFQKYKKTITHIEKKLSEISEALTKSTVNMNNAKENIRKCDGKLKRIKKTVQEQMEQIEVLKKKQDSMTEEGKLLNQHISENELKIKKFKDEKSELRKELEKIVERDNAFKSDEIKLKNKLKTIETDIAENRQLIKVITKKIADLKLTKVEGDSTELESLSEEEISHLSANTLTSELDVMKVKLESINPDLSAIEKFNTVMKRLEGKQVEVDALAAKKNLQQKRVELLTNKRYNEFSKGFNIISAKLKELYQMLTLGGDAELESCDGNNPFSKGIEFCVRPQKKTWKNIRNLSGGEKTLSSLSLVFALHYYRPTSFYVMDEIDAALDIINCGIIAFFLKMECKNTQFIIVSLRSPMNELSDHLLGITKVKNMTKYVSIHDVENWWKQTHGMNGL